MKTGPEFVNQLAERFRLDVSDIDGIDVEVLYPDSEGNVKVAFWLSRQEYDEKTADFSE